MMATGRECVCCCEIDNVKEKMKESSNEIHCITDHEGFQSVCLNVWTLFHLILVTTQASNIHICEVCYAYNNYYYDNLNLLL